MKHYLKLVWLTALCGIFFIFACVTINIYFPAEKVESVAGEIVDDIRGRDTTGENESVSSLLRRTFSVSEAWAQDYTSVSNATIRALKEKMKARYSTLKPYYEKGVLKEKDDGYLSIEDASGLDLREKRDLKNFVNAENKDRKALYGEVAEALDIESSQISKVGEIFAGEWQKTE